MVDLLEFKKNAVEHGICELLEDWNKAQSKKQLIDLALSIKGIQYLAPAIASGWGISPEVIAEEFEPFNNGRYARCQDGYTSSLYCMPKDDVCVSTTAALIINHNGDIYVDTPICELYLVNSNVTIRSDVGKAIVSAFNSTISNKDNAPIII